VFTIDSTISSILRLLVVLNLLLFMDLKKAKATTLLLFPYLSVLYALSPTLTLASSTPVVDGVKNDLRFCQFIVGCKF